MTYLAICAALVVAIPFVLAGIARLYIWANPEPEERRVDAEEGGW